MKFFIHSFESLNFFMTIISNFWFCRLTTCCSLSECSEITENVLNASDSDSRKRGQLKWALPPCDGTWTGWIGPYQRCINTSAKFYE